MKKYCFKNDYSEGCHPNILEALTHANLEQEEGYCEDNYCREARALIKNKINNPDASIHFAAGGTLANLIVAASALRPYESIISAGTGHINVHETGSIEATGHKINLVDSNDGKLRPVDIQNILEEHTTVPHMVKPRMVYISNATEVGTVYSRNELELLSSYCRGKDLFLFIDGARLANALCAADNNLNLSDYSKLTDIFTIGGTKNGALMGEAIIINNDNLKPGFDFHLKQRGALLAKGRIFGIQYYELFRSDLYLSLAKHANSMAMKIAKAVKEKGYSFLTEPATNQIFPILPNNIIDSLLNKYEFYVWQKVSNSQSAVRLVTSWATKEEKVDEFINNLKIL